MNIKFEHIGRHVSGRSQFQITVRTRDGPVDMALVESNGSHRFEHSASAPVHDFWFHGNKLSLLANKDADFLQKISGDWRYRRDRKARMFRWECFASVSRFGEHRLYHRLSDPGIL